jgi:hypothetical protein
VSEEADPLIANPARLLHPVSIPRVRARKIKSITVRRLSEMEFGEYFDTQFPRDLQRLALVPLSSNILNRWRLFRVDTFTEFFGGPEWERIHSDLRSVDPANRDPLILALFLVVTMDQCMFTHFAREYKLFRKATLFPKFGWSGFGIHNESPKKILSVPVREGLTDYAIGGNLVSSFVSFYFQFADGLFNRIHSTVGADRLISAILSDRDFAVSGNDEGSIFESIRNEMKTQLDLRRSGGQYRLPI